MAATQAFFLAIIYTVSYLEESACDRVETPFLSSVEREVGRDGSFTNGDVLSGFADS